MEKRNPLLSTNNAKTVKGEKLGYMTYIMYLSPYTANSKGINVCSHASKGCADSCLVGSGFGGMYTNVMEGRKRKTEYFEPHHFLNLPAAAGLPLPVNIISNLFPRSALFNK